MDLEKVKFIKSQEKDCEKDGHHECDGGERFLPAAGFPCQCEGGAGDGYADNRYQRSGQCEDGQQRSACGWNGLFEHLVEGVWRDLAELVYGERECKDFAAVETAERCSSQAKTRDEERREPIDNFL